MVEVKGDRWVEVNFIQALGQIVSRMDTANYNYALGFPISYKSRVMQDCLDALQRLKLRILLVEDNRKVNEVTWKELRTQQRS